MASLAPTILTTPHSGIRRMVELASTVAEPLMLVSGDPNFATPPHIVAAAAKAATAGSGYGPAAGLPALRSAIAQKVRRVNGFAVEAEQVCVTTGGCGGLFTTMLILLEPGDEILLPDPGWSNYPAMAHSLRARPVGYPLRSDTFALDPDAIEARITDRTRAIVVNSPGNPTGTIEPAERLAAVLEIAQRHDLWVISDECYDQLVFEGRHVSVATLGGAERVITVFTFSKSYAMTGWRLGYVVGPPEFIRQLALHQEPVTSGASSVSQHGALAALDGPQEGVARMTSAYRSRRDAATEALDRAAVPYVRPAGGFMLMAGIADTGLDSWTASERLLRDEGVAVVPGSAFGPGGEGFVRISLAVADEVVAEGSRRVARFVESHRR
jgi:aspartate/methionine/tyrosine aminotransferase